MVENKLMEAIAVVKENEKTASDFYANAATKTGSAVGKQLFEQLSEFERFHYARLTLLEQSLREKNDFIAYEGKDFPMPPNLAPQAAEDPLHQPVINIILLAMDLEKKAEAAYTDLAAQISNPQGQDMFTKLAGEERNHYRILKGAYESLSNLQRWSWAKA
jgi:rubrerythrin